MTADPKVGQVKRINGFMVIDLCIHTFIFIYRYACMYIYIYTVNRDLSPTRLEIIIHWNLEYPPNMVGKYHKIP